MPNVTDSRDAVRKAVVGLLSGRMPTLQGLFSKVSQVLALRLAILGIIQVT